MLAICAGVRKIQSVLASDHCPSPSYLSRKPWAGPWSSIAPMLPWPSSKPTEHPTAVASSSAPTMATVRELYPSLLLDC